MWPELEAEGLKASTDLYQQWEKLLSAVRYWAFEKKKFEADLRKAQSALAVVKRKVHDRVAGGGVIGRIVDGM